MSDLDIMVIQVLRGAHDAIRDAEKFARKKLTDGKGVLLHHKAERVLGRLTDASELLGECVNIMEA